ncbi:MAG: ABC transporter ATP-binding protein [Pirellulaceae bacterium]|nr:ABC transporter ATP-binding protein [Planctomycetaceae bacterium]
MKLSTDNLRCGYKNRKVLDQLTLHALPGQILAIIGPNGSGKTTLMRSMARLLRPQQGKVLLDEKDVWSESPRDFARRVALMPQSEVADWPLTVQESVMLGRAPHRGLLLPWTSEDINAVELAMDRCGLADLADRRITELSGGEWRRVVLARTLAQSPSVLLLDEPTSQLDLRHQIRLLEDVRRTAKDKNMTVVMTIHDLNLAASFADRFALLSGGGLLRCGVAAEVLQSAPLSAAFGIDVEVVRIPGRSCVSIVPVAMDVATREDGSP